MSKKMKMLLIVMFCLMGVGVIGAVQHHTPELEAPETEEPVKEVVLNSANVVSENPDAILKEQRVARKMRRREKMAKMMQYLALKMNGEEDREKLNQLLEEAQLSEEDRQLMEIRDNAIGEHVWTEGASVFDAMIEEQEQDPEWTNDTYHSLSEMLNTQELQTSSMTSLDCYETLCKGIFQHEDKEAYAGFQEAAARNAINGPSRGFIRNELDGSIEYTIYFARPGDDELLHEEMYDRLYEKVTGHSVDEIAIQLVESNTNE